MDFVPYEFCDRVLQSLDVERSSFHDYSQSLSGLWRTASSQHLKHRRTFYIEISHSPPDQWCYCFPQLEETPHLIEILKMDRRYVRFRFVSVASAFFKNAKFRQISEKELLWKLVPYVATQMTEKSHLTFRLDESTKTSLALLELFRNHGRFQSLHIAHCGLESQLFLVEYVANLKHLSLYGNWNEDIEDHLVRFIKSPNFECLELYNPSNLSVCTKLIRTFIEVWKEGARKKMHMRGPTGISLEDLISMAKADLYYVSEHYIQWRCEDMNLWCVIPDNICLFSE
ncbi:hypothetical protein QR680_004198 [Steinernema hermaphroditum]|uniref:Uncharacterized protein n=1 Tax=Steinernema hermaphroditum TaxID=289476 RepID=A0AA39HQ78_9BILA|nr:hypothetical protein QR680_004198 [Steinernema hermaphroditum]